MLDLSDGQVFQYSTFCLSNILMVKNAFEYKFGLFRQTPVITGIVVIAEKTYPPFLANPSLTNVE